METLFRFSLRRPAVESDDAAPPVVLRQNSELQKSLAKAREGQDPRKDMKIIARIHVTNGEFVSDISDLDGAPRIALLASTFDQLEDKEALDRAAAVAAAETALGQSPAAFIRSPEFDRNRSRLRDSMITIKLLPEEHGRPLHRLAGILRDLDVLEHLALTDGFPKDLAAFRRFRRRSLALPDSIALGSVLADRRVRDDGDNDRDAKDAKIKALLDRFRNVSRVVDELSAVSGGQLVDSAPRGSSKFLPPAELRPIALFAKEIRDGRRRVTVELESEDTSVLEKTMTTAKAIFPRHRDTVNGRSTFRPAETTTTNFRLNSDAIGKLGKSTRAVLDDLGLDTARQPVDEMVDSLRVDIDRTAAALSALDTGGVHYGFKGIGNGIVVTTTPILTPWNAILFGGLSPGVLFPVPAPQPPSVPTSHGEVAPAGVADLIVTKQQLIGYEAVDVAHIENVLKGESKIHTHRRRRQTEEFTLTETEVTTTEERDLESTDRFEMSRETSETIREDASLKAGLTVSGKYGPTVEFSASAEGSVSRSKEQATKAASTFSKEVTQRSASKITERMLQRSTLRVTTEVEETDVHTRNNVPGEGHVVGVYQWVEKLYEAQMYDYGMRTIYDFMVAEPGAFLIEAMRRAHVKATELRKPLRFPLRPNQITEYNYHGWVLEYGATDVEPPPEPYVTKSADYSAGGGDDKTDYYHSGSIQIDDGYRAIYATIGAVRNIWDDNMVIDLAIGRRVARLEDGDWTWHTSLDSEKGAISFGIVTFDVSDIAVAIEVKCQRTDRAMAKWRHDTHAKLTTAYHARQAEYEEKLAALEAEAGIEIEGHSPRQNLELMKEELKKACISIITDQHFDLFDAVEANALGLPQLDLDENAAEGPYVRFFEQAFEWEHVTWLTYPYVWGRKSEWTDRVSFEDTDPMFNQFLKAGYCRVTVPVREGFEGAVDHFLTFGEPWMGGPLPAISNPLYLPIAEELAERLNRPGDEIPVGDPWEVRLPTSLVRLRDDGSLPTWLKNADGSWSPQ